MEVFSFFEKSDIPKKSAICLGNFDGVHLGHRQLFDAAKKCGKWGVMVFERNFKNEKVLTTLDEKLQIIKGLGADYVITVKPTQDFLNTDGNEFYKILAEDYEIQSFVAGYDYRFGKDAKYSAEDLRLWCEQDDKKVCIEDEFMAGGVPVKSTRIRNHILSGEIDTANTLLGYRYFLRGVVEKGFGNGRKMGFPTANISFDEEKLLPPDGVYKGVLVRQNREYNALINIGKNPTFDAKTRTVEVHIPNFSEDMYGEKVKVEFLGKIRDEIRFDSIDELILQIKRDISSVLEK